VHDPPPTLFEPHSFRDASRRLGDNVPLAAIFLDFDPTIVIGDRTVTLWSLLLVAAILLGLACAALLVARAGVIRGERLSQVDLWMIVLGIVPGAVIGGRLGYVLIHAEYYATAPRAIVDVTQGSFQLSCAVVLGALTGAYVATVIEAPVGRWLHVAAIPVFGVIALGKIAMALGGAGQGQPSVRAWATAYLGDGPWASLAPTIPSDPSQLYEAGLTFIVLVVLVGLIAAGRLRRPNGQLFLVALELWLVSRFLVAFTWRDDAVLGPLVIDQLLSIAFLLLCLAIHLARRRSGAFAANPADTLRTDPSRGGPEPEWRRPGSRP
jgi:phosphatidylglycerol:prolipoprotein diacylglycerol transferase